jgi:hypothetical protein
MPARAMEPMPTPQPRHIERQVGESHREHATRLAGQLRAAEVDLTQLREVVRDAQLAVSQLVGHDLFDRLLGLIGWTRVPVGMIPATTERALAYLADRLVEGQRIPRQLSALCPCITSGPDVDGPAQECPVHGDGETFVAEVQRLRQVEHAAHAVVGRVLAAGDQVRVEEGSAMDELAQLLGVELPTVSYVVPTEGV